MHSHIIPKCIHHPRPESIHNRERNGWLTPDHIIGCPHRLCHLSEWSGGCEHGGDGLAAGACLRSGAVEGIGGHATHTAEKPVGKCAHDPRCLRVAMLKVSWKAQYGMLEVTEQ